MDVNERVMKTAALKAAIDFGKDAELDELLSTAEVFLRWLKNESV